MDLGLVGSWVYLLLEVFVSAATCNLNLVLIRAKFQCTVDTKVVGFDVLFPMALVSFRLDRWFRRYHQISVCCMAGQSLRRNQFVCF